MNTHTNDPLDNRRIDSIQDMPDVAQMHEDFPRTERAARTISLARNMLENAVRTDGKFTVITGPCSIDNSQAALEFAERVAEWRDSFPGLEIIMRAYVEKPRTRLGWGGFLKQPNGTDVDYDSGVAQTRQLMNQISEMGVPIAAELLDPMTIEYYSDFLTTGSIGARNVTSTQHRHLANGMSFPIGFKNAVNGEVGPAIDALVTSREPHSFIANTNRGLANVKAQGNDTNYLILRGGQRANGDYFGNYDLPSIDAAVRKLDAEGLQKFVIVDTSHGNSGKEPKLQSQAMGGVIQAAKAGYPIKGLMFEAYLEPGKQGMDGTQYGVSKTDACIGIQEQEALLKVLNQQL